MHLVMLASFAPLNGMCMRHKLVKPYCESGLAFPCRSHSVKCASAKLKRSLKLFGAVVADVDLPVQSRVSFLTVASRSGSINRS